MTHYLVIYEKGDRAWGAHSPDLEGCVAMGRTRAEAEVRMGEAVEHHVQQLREHGEPVPAPANFAGYVAAT